MRLTQLEPRWVRLTDKGYRHVKSIAEAQGILFLCPTCFTKNGGPVGTHAVLCWSRGRGVPDGVSPGPGRWSLIGSSFEDLTLGPEGGGASVDLGAGEWHGHITNGEVT